MELTIELVTQADIGRMAGVTRQAVSKWVAASDRNGFPAMARKGVWDKDAVQAWLNARG